MRMIVTGIVVLMLMGCGATRGMIRQISEENKANFILADDMVVDLHEIWPQISGAFKASKNLLPPLITDRVELINGIMLVKDVTSISKKDRAEAGMIFLFLFSDSSQLAYKAFAPNILDLLKIMGLL